MLSMTISAQEIGALIRATRKVRGGMTQADLSRLTGIDQANISRIEKGEVSSRIETYLTIFNALGMDAQINLFDPMPDSENGVRSDEGEISVPAASDTPFINTILNEDCLTGMSRIPDGSVDMILTDLPYGTTQCKWDAIIPLGPMWAEFRRIIKPKGAIVLTSAQPFTTTLIASNIKNFKYAWVWEKSKATGYLNAKKRPMVAHEDVLVFCYGTPPYYPQMTQGTPYEKGTAHRPTDTYGSQRVTTVRSETGMRYPRSVQYFKTAETERGEYAHLGIQQHPTQKPVELFEYLIRTYSRPGDLVLDACMGSGTTAIAAMRTERNFIGFETDPDYLSGAMLRINAERAKRNDDSTTTPQEPAPDDLDDARDQG